MEDCHYESTEQIFWEIVNAFSNKQKSEIFTKIKQHIPATTILEEILSKYANEMIDYKNSISLAIYEFYSNPMISKEENSVKKQYEISKSIWVELINYGIGTKEFKPGNPESIFNVIIFAYLGTIGEGADRCDFHFIHGKHAFPLNFIPASCALPALS